MLINSVQFKLTSNMDSYVHNKLLSGSTLHASPIWAKLNYKKFLQLSNLIWPVTLS